MLINIIFWNEKKVQETNYLQISHKTGVLVQLTTSRTIKITNISNIFWKNNAF